MDTQENFVPKITVIGLGGAGGNAVDNMIRAGAPDVSFITANTDVQALRNTLADTKIQLGKTTTQGFGAGSQPEMGEKAAQEAIDEITEAIDGSNILFITCGLGGGTGSGAAPIVASIARDKGILTCAIITTPFEWEGEGRMRIAKAALVKLEPSVDCIIVVANQNLSKLEAEITAKNAYKTADSVLYEAVKTISDLVIKQGVINLDFADIRTVMKDKGRAIIGVSLQTGENRAIRAVDAALQNPLFADEKIGGAKALLVNITGNSDNLTLRDISDAMNSIRAAIDTREAVLMQGVCYDDAMGDEVKIAIIATGIGDAVARPLTAPSFSVRETVVETAEEEPIIGVDTNLDDLVGFMKKEEEELRRKIDASAAPAAPVAPITPTEPDDDPSGGGLPTKKKSPWGGFFESLTSDSGDTFFSGSGDTMKIDLDKVEFTDNIIPIGESPKKPAQIDLVEELQALEKMGLPSIFKR